MLERYGLSVWTRALSMSEWNLDKWSHEGDTYLY